MTFLTRCIVICVSAPIIAFTLIGGVLGRTPVLENSYQHLRIFEDVVSLIQRNYVQEVDLDSVIDGALGGLSEGLDPDSTYLTVDQVNELQSDAPLDKGRIGLELTRAYYLRVIAARDDSPAANIGLRPGDYIRSINGQSTRTMSVFEGSRLLRGAPGSAVSLVILRGNPGEPNEFKLIREEISSPNVTSQIVSPDVGYLRISAFDLNTASHVVTEIGKLEQQGARKLAVDIRHTAEGPLDMGLEVAKLFISSGVLAILEENRVTREVIRVTPGDVVLSQPVTLLVNNGTAGAAELFVAALVENDRADAIGQRTFGRAALQQLVRLPNNSGLWISWAQFLTPSSNPIHREGIEPAVAVVDPPLEFGEERPDQDPTLDKALELLSNIRG